MIKQLRESYDLVKEANKLLIQGSSDYYFNQLELMHSMLFDRFSPFKIGDRVRLTKTPEITQDKAWGWLGAKHFLIKGAIAEVCSVDIRKADDGSGVFTYELRFEKDSWIDQYGQLHMRLGDKRSLYSFSELWLEAAE